MAALSTHLVNSYEAKPTGNIVQTDNSAYDASVHGTARQIQPVAPFSAAAFSPRVSHESAIKTTALQAKLNRQLGPEYISQRPGPGGGLKLTYAEGWKIINLANEVFGFDGWSSSIMSLTVDFIDLNQEPQRFSIGVTAIVRVTLRDGAFHEDIGYGTIENAKSKGAALDKCKKEAVTDAIKRALRNFGNVLGNCLYDKAYIKEVLKMQVPPAKFDRSSLHRRPEFASSNPARASSSAATTSASTSPALPSNLAASPLSPNSAGTPQVRTIGIDSNLPHQVLQQAQRSPLSALPQHVQTPPVASSHLSEEKPSTKVVRPTPGNPHIPRGLQTPGQTPHPAQRPQILRPPIRPMPRPTPSKLAVQQTSPAPATNPAPLEKAVAHTRPSSSTVIGDADTKGMSDVEFSSQFFTSDDDAFYAGVDLNAESYGNDTFNTSIDSISLSPQHHSKPPPPLEPQVPTSKPQHPQKTLDHGVTEKPSAANNTSTPTSSTSAQPPVQNAMGSFHIPGQASRIARRISLLNANGFGTGEPTMQGKEQLVPGKKRSADDMNSVNVPANTNRVVAPDGVARPGNVALRPLDIESGAVKRQKT